MLTKKGHTTKSLLAVTVNQGDLLVVLRVPMTVKDTSETGLAVMASHIDARIADGKKPSATYEKLLESIDVQREQLADFYTRLFETYQRDTDITPKVRRSSKDIAMVEMLSTMPDKMLKDFARIALGDNVDEYILPDDREALYDAYITAQKNKE